MSEDIENSCILSDIQKQSEEEIEAILSKLMKKVDELYNYRDHYFEDHSLDKAAHKADDIEHQKVELLTEFDKVKETSLIGIQKANYYYIKGRLLNVCSEFDQTSIKYLSKAVKLNPKLSEAWNELGESYWKDTNIKEANKSFEAALAQSRNPISLRNLSILLRQFSPADFQEKKKNIQKSIELAKEAINFDPSDGSSWLCYGNALLYSYFAVSQDETTLKNVLKSYKMAESDKITANHSDLHFNKGMALKYSEEYSEALRHFKFASKLDPGWELPKLEEERLVEYLRHIADSLNNKGKLKAKRLREMVQSVSDLVKNCSESEFVDSSETGLSQSNWQVQGKLVIGKVVCSIRSENQVPFSFCLLDHLGNALLVTVYNLASGAGVIIGDLVKILSPKFNKHELVIDSKEFKFSSVRVDDPVKMTVNGKPFSSSKVAGASIMSSYRTQ